MDLEAQHGRDRAFPPRRPHWGWTATSPAALALYNAGAYVIHDRITGAAENVIRRGRNTWYGADSDKVKRVLKRRARSAPAPWEKSKRYKKFLYRGNNGPMRKLPPLPARDRRLVKYNRSLYSQGLSGGPSARLPIKKRMPYSRRSKSYSGRRNRNSVNSTRVMRKRRHKRKRKSRKSALSSRQKRSVKAVVRYSEIWGPANTISRTSFKQLLSAVNKVQWSAFGLLHGITSFDRDAFIALMSSAFSMAASNTLTNDQLMTNRGILDAGNTTHLWNKKMQVKTTSQIKMVNISNSCANIIFYLVKCVDSTSNTALGEIQEARKAHFSSTSVEALEDSFDQYWTVPGSNSLRKWKLAKKWKITLNGGQTAMLRVKVPSVVFKPDMNEEINNGGFYKGQYELLTRIVGNLCHDDSATPVTNIANTIVDFQVQSLLTAKLSGDGTMQIRPTIRFNNQGLGAAGTAVLGNQEATGVGVFKDG